MATTDIIPVLKNPGEIFYNLPTPVLYEEIIRRKEGILAKGGPIVVYTGKYTGRSPNDKFIVRSKTTRNKIRWGKVNRPFTPEKFDAIESRVNAYFQNRDVFVRDCYVGADPKYRMALRIISDTARANLFSRNQFIRKAGLSNPASFKPEFTVLQATGLKADPQKDGTTSEAFVIINFDKKLVLIGATAYAGEIKKSIFTVMNYLLPLKNILGMHCSANTDKNGEVALFFGLSGTGKTALSSDPDRFLIGDDETGWSKDGVFNYEGGCYAKVINLSKKAEPQIYACTHRYGTILENVVINQKTRKINLRSDRFTANTRACYPIDFIPGYIPSGMGKHPKDIIMLTCDAFGVMPPIAKMTAEQAIYHFLSGYTAKIAGTERGITEPQATFSTCFGAPFMTRYPYFYATMLGKLIRKHKVNCWLINTGWINGPYGEGHRIEIAYTRAMVTAALNGKLDKVDMIPDPTFNVSVPVQCHGVPTRILRPQNTWKDKTKYKAKTRHLAKLFADNFEQFGKIFHGKIKAQGPNVK